MKQGDQLKVELAPIPFGIRIMNIVHCKSFLDPPAPEAIAANLMEAITAKIHGELCHDPLR